MKKIKYLHPYVSTMLLACLIVLQLINTTTSMVSGLEIVVINPQNPLNPGAKDGNFIFYTNTTSMGQKFNVTLWVFDYGIPPVFAWQVRLNYDPVLLKVTRAWTGATLNDPNYIFYGETSFNVEPSFSAGSVLLGDTLLGGENGVTPPPNPAILAEIEFQIIYAPASGNVSTNLDVNNADTYLLSYELDEIPTTKTSGYYDYVSEVPGKIPSTITINVNPTSIVIGSNVKVGGTITPVRPSVPVDISYRPKSSATWTTLTTVFTDFGDYTYIWSPPSVGTFELQATWPGDAETFGAESPAVTITVIAIGSSIITIDASPRTATIGSTIALSGAITPVRANVDVMIFARIMGSDWLLLNTVKTDSISNYVYPWTPLTIGDYEVKSSWTGDPDTLGAESNIVMVTIENVTPPPPVGEATVIVINPLTQDTSFDFTNSAYIGKRFTATIWGNVTDLFAYQVHLTIDDSLLNITGAWLPISDPRWVFYGKLPTVQPPPVFYDSDKDGINESVLIGDSLIGAASAFNGAGLLATVEFEIIRAPEKFETLSCDLDVKYADTFFLDSKLSEIPITTINGNYKWMWTAPSATFISIEPSQLTVGQPDVPLPTPPFTVNILVTAVNDLYAWQIKLYFNPSILNFTSAIYPLGHIFEGKDFVSVEPLVGIDANGTYVEFAATLLGDVPGVTGSGTLCQLTFIGIGSGTSQLSFSKLDTNLLDSNLINIPFDAFGSNVTVLGPPTPPIVPSKITLDVYPRTVMFGETVTISGFIDPTRFNAPVTIYFRPANGTWIILAEVRTNDMSQYTFWWAPPYAGTFELKSGWPGDRSTYPAESDIRTVYVIEQAFHDLAVSLDAPEFVSFGNSAGLNMTVSNLGSAAELNVDLRLVVNGTIIFYETIPAIQSGSSYTRRFQWDPKTVGVYNITAYVPLVLGEGPSYPFNNQATNFATVSTQVPEPLIHPSEGQWANYNLTVYSPYPYGQNQTIMMSFNYTHYITPFLINSTFTMQDPVTGQQQIGWTTIDTLHRWGESGIWASLWYPGWIQTNIDVGSMIQLLDSVHEVTGSQIIKAAGRDVDCWKLQFSTYGTNYTLWYDKATGLWIAMELTTPYSPEFREYLILVSTNIQVGQTLKIQTDNPMYLRSEIATLTVAYGIGDMLIENAQVLIEINYPNGTLYFLWTATTDANGTATTKFLIPDDAPYGTYTVYATAYKMGLTKATGTTTFMVVHYAPELKLWFEAPQVVLVNQELTIVLHIENIGNSTAYNVNATLTPPAYGVAFNGTINAGAETTLNITIVSPRPQRSVYTGEATYTDENGAAMPAALVQKTIIFSYHPDYPVDLIDMIVSVGSQTISVTFTVTNYGDLPVQITLITSAQHIATGLMLRSEYLTITVNPSQAVTITLTIGIPTMAPSGEYMVQGILATGLPNQGGFALVYEEQKTQV